MTDVLASGLVARLAEYRFDRDVFGRSSSVHLLPMRSTLHLPNHCRAPALSPIRRGNGSVCPRSGRTSVAAPTAARSSPSLGCPLRFGFGHSLFAACHCRQRSRSVGYTIRPTARCLSVSRALLRIARWRYRAGLAFRFCVAEWQSVRASRVLHWGAVGLTRRPNTWSPRYP